MDKVIMKATSLEQNDEKKGTTKAFVTEIKTEKDEQGTQKLIFHAVASSKAMDRDEEVLLSQGCDYSKYFGTNLANPVILDAHNYSGHSVGKTLALYVTDNDVQFDYEFAPTKDGQELELLYANGYQRAHSVGFLRKTILRINEQTPEKFVVELSNGKQVDVDLSIYGKTRPWLITAEWELLEISVCPVGCNQEALTNAVVRQYAVETIKAKLGDTPTELQIEAADAVIAKHMDEISTILKEFTGFDYKGAVPGHSTKSNMDSTWDNGKATTELAKWASSDNSGDKEKISWTKFARGFGWYDADSKENFTSYKFSHHYVEDGELVAVWRGVVSAMSGLLSSYDGPDKQGIYDHLAKHYEDMGKPVPEFKSYEEWEIPFIELGVDMSDIKECDPVTECDFGEKPYPNEHACRVKDPGDFQEGSFRTMSREHDGKKYRVIMGKLKGESTMTTQAYRYPKASWSVSEAKSHCKDHGGATFEPASTDSLEGVLLNSENDSWDISSAVLLKIATDVIANEIKEMETGVKIKLQIIQDRLDTLENSVKDSISKDSGKTSDTKVEPSEEEKMFLELGELFKDMKVS